MARQIKKTHKKLKIKRYISIVLLSIVLLFLWRLYTAPIAIPFLKPYIIKALNHDDADFEVNLSSVNLELVHSVKPIKIVANNVEYKNKTNTFKITAPKVSVSFSMKALLNGMIAPSGIEIISPNIYAFKTTQKKPTPIKDNTKSVVNEEKIKIYTNAFNSFMERFNSADNLYSESYINNIKISNASVEIHNIDHGQTYEFSDLNYTFNRTFKSMKMSFTSFLTKNEATTPFGFDLEYRPSSNKVAIETYLTEFVPAETFGSLFGASINIPLSGRIQTLVDLNKIINNKEDFITGFERSISKIIFELEGAQGSIEFDGLDDYSYNLSAILLKGAIEGELDKLEIKNALFDLGEQKISVSFNASGIKNLLLNNSYKDVKLSVQTKTNKLPFDQLSKLWPKYIAPVAWQWCEESLIGGLANNVNFKFDFAYDKEKNNITFKSLNGVVDLFDTNVDYLTGMPKINNVYGTANFNNDEIKINIQKGVTDGISINDGYVRLYDLSAESAIDISLKAHSSITNALKLISNPPIEYGKDLDISPELIKGYGDIELSLKFLLTKEIYTKDIDISLKAKLEDIYIPKVVNNWDFSSSSLTLTLNNSGLEISGPSVINNIPVDLLWTEGFSKEDVSNYQIGFTFNQEVKDMLGLNLSILKEPYITGAPKAIANISTKNNITTINVNGDLTNSIVDFAFLGIIKPAQTKANLSAKIILKGNDVHSIPELSYSQEDFGLQSALRLDAQNRVTHIEIPKITGNKTFAKGDIAINYKDDKPSYKINITGDSYNLTKLFSKENLSYKKQQIDNNQTTQKGLEDTDDAQIFISVNSLWTIDEFPIKNFAGSAVMKNNIGIEELHLIGNFDKSQQSTIKVDYEPRTQDEFFLDIESTNAGATLKVLGIYDNMEGGILKIQAKRDKAKKLYGHAKIRDVSIHNTPVMAKLLTVASLSGLLNMLTGDGIEFSHIDAPFEYQNKILTTTKAKASGNVMVITANGDYNQTTKNINIKGVVAPLRGLDSLISSIPLIGDLLTGKDGTVFAANYEISGTSKKPEVNINPFSALSPSSLKDLVGVNSDEQ